MNPYEGKSLKEILKSVIGKIADLEQVGKKQIKSVFKVLTPFFKIYDVKDDSGVFLEPREKDEASGEGVFLKPYKGKALKDILLPVIDKIADLEQEGKKQIKKVIKALTPFFKIYEVKNGSGIFLEPH